MTDLIDRADSGEIPTHANAYAWDTNARLATRNMAHAIEYRRPSATGEIPAIPSGPGIGIYPRADGRAQLERLAVGDTLRFDGPVPPLSQIPARLRPPAAYGTVPPNAPTTPPPPPPPPPASRPNHYTGKRRQPAPWWMHALAYTGTLLMGVMGGASLMLVTLTASGHVW